MIEDDENIDVDPLKTGEQDMRRHCLETIVFHSLLVGLTPFVPVPFLGDWACGMIMRMLYRRLLITSGFTEPEKVAVVLHDGPSSASGCFWNVLALPWTLFKNTLLWVICKVIKLVLFFLVIDECANLMSEAFHRGYLLSYVLRHRELTEHDASDERLVLVHNRIKKACAKLDTKILRKTLARVFRESPALLKQSGKLLKDAGKTLKEALKNRTLPDDLRPEREGGVIHKLTERVLDNLVNMPDYLGAIESAYEGVWLAEKDRSPVS